MGYRDLPDKTLLGWLKGRKRICEYLDCSWSTVRRWHRHHGLPIYTGPDHRPTAIAHELDKWLKTQAGP
jgi:hypothetical protein